VREATATTVWCRSRPKRPLLSRRVAGQPVAAARRSRQSNGCRQRAPAALPSPSPVSRWPFCEIDSRLTARAAGARAGRRAVRGSGALETWKAGVPTTAAPDRQLARFSGPQVPRTRGPPPRPGSVGALRGSVAASAVAPGKLLTRFEFRRAVRFRRRFGSAPVRRNLAQAVEGDQVLARIGARRTPRVRNGLGPRGSVGRPREKPLGIFGLRANS